MITGPQQISNQAIKDVSSVQKMPLGTLVQTADGRKFRYAQAGGTDLVAANLLVNADAVANHANLAIADVSVANDLKLTSITIGATALTADQYKDGYVTVRDNTGEGFSYVIAGHNAYSASATDVQIDLTDPIEVATDATSELTLNYNPYDLLVISATDQADLAVGVAHRAVDRSEATYFFVQTGGIATVFGDEAYARGAALTIGTGAAGQVEAADAAGEQIIGTALEAGVAGEHTLAFLTLD